jgi:hypothetical protein
MKYGLGQIPRRCRLFDARSEEPANEKTPPGGGITRRGFSRKVRAAEQGTAGYQRLPNRNGFWIRRLCRRPNTSIRAAR